MASSKKVRRKKQVMFCSLLLCFLSASLLSAAFGTEYWFESDSKWSFENGTSGNINFGLFGGMNYFTVNQYRTHTLHVVCLDDKCMYSCGTSKEYREEQLKMLLRGETENLKVHCSADDMKQAAMLVHLAKADKEQEVDAMKNTSQRSKVSPGSRAAEIMPYEDESEYSMEDTVDFYRIVPPILRNSSGDNSNELEFMDYGLWVGTITCLSAGLLMAVVGALFAIVNTATTPVEAITGVPGLYLWNGLAAVFDMVTVILWAVQFHKHLTSNVLLYDAGDGWSTKGLEAFGYSFWLVVVAIFVHVANIVIIVVGTYEPKKKSQVETPETKDGIILLY